MQEKDVFINMIYSSFFYDSYIDQVINGFIQRKKISNIIDLSNCFQINFFEG